MDKTSATAIPKMAGTARDGARPVKPISWGRIRRCRVPALLLAGALLAAHPALAYEADDGAIQNPPLPHAVYLAHAVWLTADMEQLQEYIQFFQGPPGAADEWLGPDKLLHFGVSAMLTLSTQYFLVHQMDLPNDRAWPVSAGTALAFGLFKELADSQRSRDPLFSWKDVTANAAGIGFALAVILL